VAPAPLAGEGELARHGRAGDRREGGPLPEVAQRNVDGAEERGAHRTRPLALGAEHPEVGDERVVPAEQVGEADRPAFLVEKRVVAGRAAGRQRAPHRRDPLEVPAQLDLLGEQRGAGGAVLGAVVRIGLAGLGGELVGRLQCFHRAPLSVERRRQIAAPADRSAPRRRRL